VECNAEHGLKLALKTYNSSACRICFEKVLFLLSLKNIPRGQAGNATFVVAWHLFACVAVRWLIAGFAVDAGRYRAVAGCCCAP
jgi:hypothetical protein